MNRGWYFESARHALARRGIHTALYRPGKATFRGVPISVQKVPEGQVYPVSVEDVKTELERMPKRELRSLKGVELVPPRDDAERDAWARYIRSRRVMLIFSQPVSKSGKVAGEEPEHVKQHMIQYVLPHELGHHKALTVEGITDKKLSMAEARADAAVAGMSVKDKDARVFQSRHREADRRFNAKLTLEQQFGYIPPRRAVLKYRYAGRREIGKIQPPRYERDNVKPGDQVEVWVKSPKTGPFRGMKYPAPDKVWARINYRRGRRIIAEVTSPGRFVPEITVGRKLQFQASNIAAIRRY